MPLQQFEQHVLFRFRLIIFALILCATVYSLTVLPRVEKSYEYFSTLPPKTPAAQAFQQFKTTFQQDVNPIVIGIDAPHLFHADSLYAYYQLVQSLKRIDGIRNVLSIFNTVALKHDVREKKFIVENIFEPTHFQQSQIDSAKQKFKHQLFYKGLLYRDDAFLMLVNLQPHLAMTKAREGIVHRIDSVVFLFEHKHQNLHLTGLPLIRTRISTLISQELRTLLLFSAFFLLVIVAFIYRSWIDVFITLIILGIGIVWSFGTLYVLDYKITLLTAIVPSLIIIIGVPNAIYFLNKYHAQLQQGLSKNQAILNMVNSMGRITLFCNLTMAIGFFVFMFTESPLLHEFGLVAGINIVLKFCLSYTLIPLLLYYLPTHQKRHFNNAASPQTLVIASFYAFIQRNQKMLFLVTAVLLMTAFVGMNQLKTVSFIMDDVPKKNVIMHDVEFFDQHFKGIFPLEIILKNKRKTPLTSRLNELDRIENLCTDMATLSHITKPLSILDQLKFVRQAYYFNDTNSYALPNQFDIAFIAPYLKQANDTSNRSLSQLSNSLLDSTKQSLRLSIRMADIGSEQLALLKDSLQQKIIAAIDTSTLSYTITGAAMTFLEGNIFIMKGLRESILWAIVLISICMIYLFRSVKIILISIVLNILPLLVSMGIMGFCGVPFQPSTVIIFSIVLGISVDITIRYLVTFRELYKTNNALDIHQINAQTLQETFFSITYTGLALVGGFLIFSISTFNSIQALGWLTAVSLFVASIFNLVFLPLLLNYFYAKK